MDIKLTRNFYKKAVIFERKERMKLYQQGDVLLFTVDKIPPSAKRHKNNHLAEGEATGHYHAAMSGTVMAEKEDLYLDAPAGCEVTHQEHKPITLPPGKFKVGIVQEYDHFAEEARQVRD
jgi:hypothetical protein